MKKRKEDNVDDDKIDKNQKKKQLIMINKDNKMANLLKKYTRMKHQKHKGLGLRKIYL